MNDNDPQNIQIILDESLVAIKSGQETIDSILKKYPHLAMELRPDLEASLWLSAQRASLEPRPGFISASRARLLAEIKQNNPTAVASRRSPFLPSLRQIFQRKYALQFALIFILFIGFLSSGAVFAEAANRSIPGDPLFKTKLVIEDTRLATTLTDIGHVRLGIKYIGNRSHELQQVIQLARYEYIPEAVDRFDNQVEHVIVDLEELADTRPEDALMLTASLDKIVADQMIMLTAMADDVPSEVRGSVQNALVVTQSSSLSVNDLLQKIIITSPTSSPTLVSQASDTPLPTLTSTQLLTATATPTPTTTSTLTSTPTPTATGLAILPLPTYTPTSVEIINTEEPTDTSVPPTVIVNTPTPTDNEEPTNTPETPDPTDIPEPDTPTPVPPTPTPVPPTPTPDPGDPTDIPNPTNPSEPPDPTGIPN